MEFEPYLAAHRQRRAAAAVQSASIAAAGRAAAANAAEELARRFGVRRVVLFGSLARGRFSERSDIDLAVEGLPPGGLFEAMAVAEKGRNFRFEIVPLEAAFDYIRAAVERDGVQLWPR